MPHLPRHVTRQIRWECDFTRGAEISGVMASEAYIIFNMQYAFRHMRVRFDIIVMIMLKLSLRLKCRRHYWITEEHQSFCHGQHCLKCHAVFLFWKNIWRPDYFAVWSIVSLLNWHGDVMQIKGLSWFFSVWNQILLVSFCCLSPMSS